MNTIFNFLLKSFSLNGLRCFAADKNTASNSGRTANDWGAYAKSHGWADDKAGCTYFDECSFSFLAGAIFMLVFIIGAATQVWDDFESCV